MSYTNPWEDEQNTLNNRPYDGPGGSTKGVKYAKVPQPAQKNQTLTWDFRIVPRLKWVNGQPTNEVHAKPWVRGNVHKAKIEGKWQQFTCPDDHDKSDWMSRISCPACRLWNDLSQAKNPEFGGAIEGLRVGIKAYMNVIDLAKPAEHWEAVPATTTTPATYQIHPFVWTPGKRAFNKLIAIGLVKRAIEDVQIGRNLRLSIKKTGPDPQNIEYELTDFDPTPLDPNLMPVVMGAWDLEGFTVPAKLEDLERFAGYFDPRRGRPMTPAAGSYGPAPTAPAMGAPVNYPQGVAQPAPYPPAPYPPPQGFPPQMQQPYPPANGQPPQGWQQPQQAAYPPQQAYPPQPPVQPMAGPPPTPVQQMTMYVHAAPDGRQTTEQSALQIARMVMSVAGPHSAWAPGMATWTPVEQIPEIAASINMLRASQPQHMPPPNPVALQTGQPQGGWPVNGGPPGGPPQQPVAGPPPQGQGWQNPPPPQTWQQPAPPQPGPPQAPMMQPPPAPGPPGSAWPSNIPPPPPVGGAMGGPPPPPMPPQGSTSF